MIRVHETWNNGTEPTSFTLESWDQFDSYVKTLSAVPYWQDTTRFVYSDYTKMLPNKVRFVSIHEGHDSLIHLSAELAQHHSIRDCAFCRLHVN
jgi:hypothetical protein